MNRHVIFDYSGYMAEKLSGYHVIPRVKCLEDIDSAVMETGKQNQVYCVWADCSLMSISDMRWETVQTDMPIILYAYSIGDTFRVLMEIERLRRLNIRIFLSSTCQENFHAIKVLSSLGVDAGILMDARHINDDFFLDLASYALLSNAPHASIEPFDYIGRNVTQSENLDIRTIYFDNPSKYIYVNENLDFAFSEEALMNKDYVGNLSDMTEIDFNTETSVKLDRYYSHFISLDDCCKCPSFKVCDRKSQTVFTDCKDVYSTIFEYAEISNSQRREPQRKKRLCQL